MKHLIVKSPIDNVGNALEDIEPGDTVTWHQHDEVSELNAVDKIPFAFKMALHCIPKGTTIICYGEPVGIASEEIAAGACVHVHNVRGQRGNA